MSPCRCSGTRLYPNWFWRNSVLSTDHRIRQQVSGVRHSLNILTSEEKATSTLEMFTGVHTCSTTTKQKCSVSGTCYEEMLTGADTCSTCETAQVAWQGEFLWRAEYLKFRVAYRCRYLQYLWDSLDHVGMGKSSNMSSTWCAEQFTSAEVLAVSVVHLRPYRQWKVLQHTQYLMGRDASGAETPAVPVRQPRSCGQGRVFKHFQYLMFGDVYRCRDTCSTCGTTQVVWAKGSPPTCWRSGASLQTGLC